MIRFIDAHKARRSAGLWTDQRGPVSCMATRFGARSSNTKVMYANRTVAAITATDSRRATEERQWLLQRLDRGHGRSRVVLVVAQVVGHLGL